MCTTSKKYASWIVYITWSLEKLGHNGPRGENSMHSSCIIIFQWTWQEIPYIKGLECYENNFKFTILVVVWCWTNISWAPYVIQNTILPPKGNWWWWCDISLVGWFEIGSICIFCYCHNEKLQFHHVVLTNDIPNIIINIMDGIEPSMPPFIHCTFIM